MTVKRKQIRFAGYYLAIGLLIVLTTVLSSCTCSSPKPSTTATATSLTPPGPTSTSQLTTATTTPTSKPISTITALTSFPYQGSGTGVWSGQITYNDNTYSVGGTLTLAIDANGVVSGSMTDSSGNNITVTQRTLQVDPNGNITGSSSFVVRSTTFNFTWQGKVTTSGNNLSIKGTWTGQYGSGTFSGTGTK
jgi:hypothetical protein